MNLSRVNLNLLIALDALLTEKNVTKAGKKIFVTQSAMSVALRQLRELFEDDLLIRQGNNLLLTEKAEALSPKVKKLLDEVHHLIQHETFNPNTSQRVFRIGLTEYSAFILLPYLYTYLQTHAPHIQLQIKHMTLFSEKELFEKNEIDLAIGIMRENNGLQSEKLFSDTLVSAARADHPLMQSPLTLETYLDAQHLCFTVQDNTCPYITDMVLSNMGLPRKVILRVPHVISALYIIVNSDLLITLPKGIIQEASKLLPLTTQTPPFPLPPISFMQMWHPFHTDDEGHYWLRQAIKKVSEKIPMY